MRKTITILLLLTAAMAMSQENMARFGNWIVADMSGNLMDEGFPIMMLVSNDAVVGMRYPDTIVITFPDFLGMENEEHDKSVRFASDKIDAYTLPTSGYRTNTSIVVWKGPDARAMIEQVLQADVMMFRTYDFRNNPVDAVFNEPHNLALDAWSELKNRTAEE